MVITSVLGTKELIIDHIIDDEIDLSNLALGIHFVTVLNEEKHFTFKIIKK